METSAADLRQRSTLDFYRTVGGAKPFLFLYYSPNAISRATTEEYVQQFIAMGLSPEVKGNPWGCNKKRDADLLNKFLPIYRRLDRAGWQPVTDATVAPRTVWMERFGVKPPELYFTLYNPGPQPVRARLTIEAKQLGLPAPPKLAELVEGRPVLSPQDEMTIPARSLRVVQWHATGIAPSVSK